jgi:hypothetical protein
VLCAGCAAVDPQAESVPAQASVPEAEDLLAQADARMIAEDYRGAITSYAAFATAQPDHAQAGRALAAQKALARLVASEAAVNRAQQGSDATRRELTERQAETDRLKAEIAKLRADLERLRSIDLQLQKK